MLSQRKRYNYMMGSNYSTRQKYSFDKQNSQNLKGSAFRDSAQKTSTEYQQKINELQRMNKELVQNTAKQFQQFQQDVARVQNILEQKQKLNNTLESQKNKLQQDKSLLIQALSQKDDLIKELQNQLQLLIRQKSDKKIECESQTENIQGNQQQNQRKDYQIKYKQVLQKCENHEEQIYQLKEELYTTNSQLNLLKQQHSTMKLLQQIESVKNQ